MGQREDVGTVGLPRREAESADAFARVMVTKLRANVHKGGWINSDPKDLLRRAREELDELEKELERYSQLKLVHFAGVSAPWQQVGEVGGPTDNVEAMVATEKEMAEVGRRIGLEAADVGNFVMMIADVCGGLRGW